MIVADRRVTQEILKDSGFKNTHAMTNEQLTDSLRFLTGDRTAQVTNEFSDGFVLSLRQVMRNQLGLKLNEESMPAKAKKNAATTRGRAARTPPKAVKRSRYTTSRKSPGICRFILSMLKNASRKEPITRAEILAALVKAFPHRDSAKMANTLSKVSYWLYHNHGYELRKDGEGGYWATRVKAVTA